MIHRRLLIASASIAAILITACDGPGSSPTAPVAPTISANRQGGEHSESESSPRRGVLHVTKECSAYTGLADAYCTITSSSLKAIEVGSKVVYAQAKGPTTLDSDITVYPPGTGTSRAFGHVMIDFVTRTGTITFSGGTGKFKGFHAAAAVSHLVGPNWAWDGTYSFTRKGEHADNDGDADDDGDHGDNH
jgi:hypothetical protein